MTTVQKPSYTPEMDHQEALIRAYMRLTDPEWHEKTKIPRAQVVHFALDHWLNEPGLDADQVIDWYKDVEANDTNAGVNRTMKTRAVYFNAELHDKTQTLGARIRDAGITLKLLTSTGGDFNRRLVIALAFERLARIIRKQHPDLEPESND